MLRDSFMNIAILVSFIFITAEIFKSHAKILRSYKRVVFLGSVSGFLGVILMWCNISITPFMTVDLRYLAIILVSFYSGLSCSILSSLIMGLAGLAFWGVSTSSMIESGLLLVFALMCSAVIKFQRLWWLKWVCVVICNCLIVCAAFIMRGDSNVYTKTLYQSLLTLLAGIISRCCAEYVKYSTIRYIQFKEQSTRDFLTGLTNTRYFHTVLQNYIKEVGQYAKKLSIIMIDIDFFKHINDKYGHAAGNDVLKQLSVILTKTCSPYDAVSRVGGEEFAVLIYDYPHSIMLEIAENLRLTIQDHRFLLPYGRSIRITASIGVATYPDTVADISTIFEQADKALYELRIPAEIQPVLLREL